MIKAEGIKDNEKLVVVYEDGKYTFNGKEDKLLEGELKTVLRMDIPVLGTYCSTDPEDELNIIGKLQEHFFDAYAVVTSDKEIKPDWNKGEVY